MKTNVKFRKQVTVDLEECRTAEITEKTFYRNQTVKDVGIEILSEGYANLQFENGDLAISVPRNAFEVAKA